MTDTREDRIRRRAHEIWEREGRRHGEHERHWAQATQEIAGEDAALAPETPADIAAAKPAAALRKPAKPRAPAGRKKG